MTATRRPSTCRLSEAAQREAGEKLSVRGHLQRDPETIGRWVAPNREAVWGLAW